MNKRKGILEKLVEIYIDNVNFKRLLAILLEYYKTYDMEYDTNIMIYFMPFILNTKMVMKKLRMTIMCRLIRLRDT
jgi:hypothetical protein